MLAPPFALHRVMTNERLNDMVSKSIQVLLMNDNRSMMMVLMMMMMMMIMQVPEPRRVPGHAGSRPVVPPRPVPQPRPARARHPGSPRHQLAADGRHAHVQEAIRGVAAWRAEWQPDAQSTSCTHARTHTHRVGIYLRQSLSPQTSHHAMRYVLIVTSGRVLDGRIAGATWSPVDGVSTSPAVHGLDRR